MKKKVRNLRFDLHIQVCLKIPVNEELLQAMDKFDEDDPLNGKHDLPTDEPYVSSGYLDSKILASKITVKVRIIDFRRWRHVHGQSSSVHGSLFSLRPFTTTVPNGTTSWTWSRTASWSTCPSTTAAGGRATTGARSSTGSRPTVSRYRSPQSRNTYIVLKNLFQKGYFKEVKVKKVKNRNSFCPGNRRPGTRRRQQRAYAVGQLAERGL